MERLDKIRLSRRDMLKVSAGGAGMFAIGAGGLAVPRGLARGGGGGSLYIEAFPTSPLILNPFKDQLTIPTALAPTDPAGWDSSGGMPDPKIQDSLGKSPTSAYKDRYGMTLGEHQLWPGQGVTSTYDWISTKPVVYQIKLNVAKHDFTTSDVQPITSLGQNVTPPKSVNSSARKLPSSTIYGFNGTFPGP